MSHWYSDIKVKTQNKIAVVICSYAGKGSYHYWHDPKEEEKQFDDIKFTLNAHERFKKDTLPYDLIVVDNASPYQPFKDWIKTWVNNEDHIFLERENDAFSYGAFEHAWKTFGEKYDYYLFQEQDMMPCKEHWLEELILSFLSETGIGMIGGVVETNNIGERFYINRPTIINLGGLLFFTSSKILKEVGMKIYRGPGNSAGVTNEINFSQPVLDNGYKVKAVFNLNKTYSHLSDGSANNIVLPVEETIAPMITIHIRRRKEERDNPIREYFIKKGLI